MLRLSITQNPDGSHDYNTAPAAVPVPAGWAVVPDGMEIPNTFPYVSIQVDGKTVTAMTAGTVPAPAPDPTPDPAPTIDQRVASLEESNAELTEALNLILLGVTE